MKGNLHCYATFHSKILQSLEISINFPSSAIPHHCCKLRTSHSSDKLSVSLTKLLAHLLGYKLIDKCVLYFISILRSRI